MLNLEDDSLTRWTYSEVGGLPTDEFVVPELIHYPTFDEVDGEPREIPAFLFKPNDDDGESTRSLIYIHGGPESQFIPLLLVDLPVLPSRVGCRRCRP